MRTPLQLDVRRFGPATRRTKDGDVAVIIGHAGAERIPLVQQAVASLRQQSLSCEIVLVEQGLTDACRTSLEPLVDRYLFCRSASPFSRGWTLNVGAVATTKKYLLLHDGDLVCPHDYLEWAVSRIGDYDLLTPWSRMIYLDEAASGQWIRARGPVEDNVFPLQLMTPSPKRAAGGSTLVKRSLFLRAGGYDERLVGWGAEDNVFYLKALSLGNVAPIPLEGPTLVHLFHPPADPNTQESKQNRKIARWYFRASADAIRSQIRNAYPIGDPHHPLLAVSEPNTHIQSAKHDAQTSSTFATNSFREESPTMSSVRSKQETTLFEALSNAEQAPLPYEDLKKKHVFFATPCYGGQLTEPYFKSFCHALMRFKELGIGCSIATLANEALISRARNTLVSFFLAEQEPTHLMFIDADVGFDGESILRMLAFDQDIVVGAYPRKNINWPQVAQAVRDGAPNEELLDYSGSFVVNFKYDDGTHQSFRLENGLIEVTDAGTGFMLIKREVFVKMIEAHPELHYKSDLNIDPQYHPFTYSLFDCMHDPETNRYLSEDFTFCRRWQRLGGKIWLDPMIQLVHVGHYIYNGFLARMIRFQADEQQS